MFQIGKKVVCIRPAIGCWRANVGPLDKFGDKPEIDGPKRHDIVTIHSIEGDELFFVEYLYVKEGYPSCFFRPLDETQAEEIIRALELEFSKEKIGV